MDSGLPPALSSARRVCWLLIAAAGLGLCALVAVSPRHPVHDEQWFLDTLDLLKRHGLSIGFLREFPGAAGPTFTLVYAAIDGIVSLNFPWLRLINVGLLAAAVILTWRILRHASGKQPASSPGPALLAASLIMLPTIGVAAGMALTEMPAVFFILVSVLLLTYARDPASKPALAWPAAIGSGIAVAFAVLGRQNYLAMLPCLALAFGWPPSVRRSDILKAGVIVATVALIAGPVFIVWGGLIPPMSAWSGAGLLPANAIRSAGYAGLIVLLFAPEIFGVLWRRKRVLAAAALASLPLSLATGRATIPMASMMRPIFSEQVAAAFAAGFSFVLSLSAVCFAGCFASYIWQERGNWLTRFAGSTALLGILSNARITHQFSSRYVFVFLPFIVLSAAPAVRMSWHLPLRLAVGACINLGALGSYYYSGQ